MLAPLKFVARGVGRKDFVPGLTHYRIKDGRCTGTNGVLTLSCPVDISFDAAPHAADFIKAIAACEDVVSLTLQDDGILVKSGAFKRIVPCLPIDQVAPALPEGVVYRASCSLLDGLRALKPFVGIDASKPWATGVLLAGQSAYATNNIVIAQCWLGDAFPVVCNVPDVAIDEALAVGEEMSHLQINESSITFHYEDGRWIKTPLLSLEWPNIPALVERCWEGVTMTTIPEGLPAACDKLAGFNEKHKEHLYFRGSEVSTTPKGIEDKGAVVEMIVPPSGCYHTAHMRKVLAVATHADFTKYPNAVPFMGGMLRGAMLGVLE